MTRAVQMSPWIDLHRSEQATTPRSSVRPVCYDVAVVGAGVVGCTAALEAVRRGMSVVIIDAEVDAALGVSGQSTVKITCGHGLRAAQIAKAHGEDSALEYLRASDAGLAFVRRHVGPAVVVNHDVYASDSADVAALNESIVLAQRAGIEVEVLTPDDVQFHAESAVRYPGALLVDPVEYVRGLLAEATALGCDVGFGMPLIGFDAGDPHEIRTPHSSIQARHVILATHVPVLNRTFAFAKLVQRRHFGVAGEVDVEVPTTYDVSGRSFSTRPFGEHGAIVVGAAVNTGHTPGTEAMHAVCIWAETQLGLRLTHTWSSQDGHPADEMPLVGAVIGTPRLSYATAFAGWGFTAGTAAGIDLVRRIAGEPVRAPGWKPDRIGLLRGLGTMATVSAWTAKGIVAEALGLPPRDLLEAAAALSPGQGVVVREGTKPQAVSVDRGGTVRIVNGRCSHLGCVVRWDAESEAWACPCHGSRFAPDGRVLHGPATAPLTPYGEANVQHDEATG